MKPTVPNKEEELVVKKRQQTTANAASRRQTRTRQTFTHQPVPSAGWRRQAAWRADAYSGKNAHAATQRPAQRCCWGTESPVEGICQKFFFFFFGAAASREPFLPAHSGALSHHETGAGKRVRRPVPMSSRFFSLRNEKGLPVPLILPAGAEQQ
jgi:hypothetical protein